MPKLCKKPYKDLTRRGVVVVSPLFVNSVATPTSQTMNPPHNRTARLPVLAVERDFRSSGGLRINHGRLVGPRTIARSQIRRIRDSRQLPALLSGHGLEQGRSAMGMPVWVCHCRRPIADL